MKKDREALPIKAFENDIIEAVRANQVVLVAGK